MVNTTDEKIIDYTEIYSDIDKFIDKILDKNKNLKEFEKKAIIGLREQIAELGYYTYYRNNESKFAFLKTIFYGLTRKIKFVNNVNSPIVVLMKNDRFDHKCFVDEINFPLVKMKFVQNKSIRYFICNALNIINIYFRTIRTLLIVKDITKLISYIDACFLFEMLYKFYLGYYCADLKNIKIILTSDTIYGANVAGFIAKCDDCNVKVIKIELYNSNVKTGITNRLNSTYCFVVDKIHEAYYKQFQCNQGVKFIHPGGRLSCDFLYEYTKKTKISNPKKQIVFLTNCKPFDDLDEYYITLIKNFIAEHENYELILKPHPSDTRDYKEYLSDRIRIENLFGKDYFDFVYNADFVFAVFSTLLYQTKLINPNCYALGRHNNKKMEIWGISDSQDAYAQYLEVIKVEEMLKKVLLGEHKTTTCEYYIKELNPNFGHVVKSFKQSVENLL